MASNALQNAWSDQEASLRCSMFLAAGVLLGISNLPAVAQSAGQTIDVGGWKVTRTHKPDGAFEQCSSNIKYDDSSVLAFVVNNEGKVFVVLVEPTLKLIEGQVYKSEFYVDRKTATAVDAVAANATTLVLPIVKNDDAFMSAASAGNALFIESGGLVHENPLTGSGKAIDQLAACVVAGVKAS